MTRYASGMLLLLAVATRPAAGGDFTDCNGNGVPDDCDVAAPGTCGEYEPPPFAGGGGSASGCDDPDCRATVCAVDAFCCETAWDDVCAREALRLCGDSTDCNLNGVPDECECVGDTDANDDVGFADLNVVLAAWGMVQLPDPPLAGDLDCSGSVGFSDLNLLLGNWGPCPIP